MPEFPLRRITIQLEDVLHDGGPAATAPHQRGAIMAVVENPFAGLYEPDLESVIDGLKPLGLMLSGRLIDAMGGPQGIDAFGKGAMVGSAGETEHGALWHVAGGYAMRERLGECRAIVPSAMKVAPMGAILDIPLGHVNAAYVRSRFDVITVMIHDAPRPNEIVFALAMARGGRVHSRLGGLEVDQVKGQDGLR